MGSTSSERINRSASAQKLDVDHRISLGVYLRMADDFLKQADKHRQEKNVVDLYISLLRFSSLVSETIPYHRDYRGSDEPEKVSLKKKLLNALNELEELKPAVEEMLNEKRNARQNPAWSCNLQPVGAPTSSIRINIVNSDSFPEKRTIFSPLSRPKQECEYGSPFGLPCNQKVIKKVLCAVIAKGINARDGKKPQDAGIYTCDGLMMQTKKKLTGIEDLSKAKVDTICEAFEKMVVGTILHNMKCSSKIVCTASDQPERVSLKKKALNAPSELEEYLKPAVKQMLNEKRIAYQNHLQLVGAPSSHVPNNIGNSSSFLEKHTIFRSLSHPKQEFEYSSPLGLPIQEEKKETGIEHLPRDEHDWQQLQWFSNACKGIQEPTAPPAEEDLELVMAINASIQSALQERLPIHETSASGSSTTSMDSGDWSGHESGPRWDSTLHTENHDISTIQTTATSDSIPSSPTTTTSSSSSCVICWDGPVEGAFIPCGHMAGCMPCLNEINAKNWDCPVCRGKVDQVIRLYAV